MEEWMSALMNPLTELKFPYNGLKDNLVETNLTTNNDTITTTINFTDTISEDSS